MSRHSQLRSLANDYGEKGYNIIAVNEGYPGIFTEKAEEHKLEGRVDILLEDEPLSRLKILQVGFPGSLDPDTITNNYCKKANRVENAINYFESLDLDYEEIQGKAMLEPEGDLKTLKEIWKGTTGIFSWEDVTDCVSEPERLGNMKNDVIVEWADSPIHQSKKYQIDEEYEDILDLFVNELI